jgi:hypothetical protein
MHKIPGEPEIITRGGETVYLTDGWSVDDPNNLKVVKFGLLKADLIRYRGRGLNTALAQFDSIVIPGLIMARHFFRGLNRPLCTDDCMEGDAKKIAHSWRPACDYVWLKPYGRPQRLDVEGNRVIVVLVGKNERHVEQWPEVYGWIDRWSWVFEDPNLPGAPIDWESRYAEKLCTR